MTNSEIVEILARLNLALTETVPLRHYEATWGALKQCRNIIENLMVRVEAAKNPKDAELIKETKVYLEILSGNLGDFDKKSFTNLKDYRVRDLMKYPNERPKRSRKKHHP